MTRCGIAGLVLMLSVARHAPGQGVPDPRSANPERPTVATHAYAVAPGYVELEQGARVGGHASLAEAFFWDVNLKVGLTSWSQIALTGDPFVQTKRGSGLGDLGVTIKERTDVSPRAAVALVETVLAPTGNATLGLGTDHLVVNLVGVVSLDLSSRWHVDINAGPTGIGVGQPQWFATAAFGWSGGSKLGFQVETFGYTTGAAGVSTQGILGSVLYRATRSAVVDAGGSWSNGSAGVSQVFLGLTLNLGGLWRTPPRTP